MFPADSILSFFFFKKKKNFGINRRRDKCLVLPQAGYASGQDVIYQLTYNSKVISGKSSGLLVLAMSCLQQVKTQLEEWLNIAKLCENSVLNEHNEFSLPPN